MRLESESFLSRRENQGAVSLVFYVLTDLSSLKNIIIYNLMSESNKQLERRARLAKLQ